MTFYSHDQVTDSPTNVFATLNPLDGQYQSYYDISDGNLKLTNSTLANTIDYANYLVSSIFFNMDNSFYFEYIMPDLGDSSGNYVGLYQKETIDYSLQYGRPHAINGTHNAVYMWSNNGQVVRINSSGSTTYDASLSISTTTIIGVFYKSTDQTVSFYNNGTLEESVDISSFNTAYLLRPMFHSHYGEIRINFGHDSSFGGNVTSGSANATDANGLGDFYYAPPTGALALCSANLRDPILNPSENLSAEDFFKAVTYPGTGSQGDYAVVTGMQPDLVWIKCRNVGHEHYLVDSVKGVNHALSSSSTTNSITPIEFTSFNTDGFTAKFTSGGGRTAYSSDGPFVAWTWKAGGATPSKTYNVKVVADGGNKYRFIDDITNTNHPTLNLQEGGTYTFDVSDSTMSSHPFVLGTSSGTDGSYTTGVTYELDGVSKTYSQYTSGFSSATVRKLIITVASSAPTLYYNCSVHSGMGGQINTTTTHGQTEFGGSVIPIVSVNKEAGFSIVKYTGNGTNGATLAHGLGKKPKIIIEKAYAGASTYYNWSVQGCGELWSDATQNLFLNTNGALNPSGAHGVPDSNTFHPSKTNYANENNVENIAYIWTDIEGYSSIGTYIGNGVADGAFVYTGFRPAWVMARRTATANWCIFDNARNSVNPINGELYADTTANENTSDDDIDFLSNGFKIRRGVTNFNDNNSSHLYMAFAEQPGKYSNAR